MSRVICSGGDPLFDLVDFIARQPVAGFRGRHPFRFFVAGDPPQQFAFLGRTWCQNAAIDCSIPEIQPQIGFTMRLIRTVARETVLGQYGPNFITEVRSGPLGTDGSCYRERRCGETGKKLPRQSVHDA
jgi:hypothetical protein